MCTARARFFLGIKLVNFACQLPMNCSPTRYWCPSLTCAPAFSVFIPLYCLGFQGVSVESLLPSRCISPPEVLIFPRCCPSSQSVTASPPMVLGWLQHGGSAETLLFDNPAYLYTVTRPHARDGRDYFLHITAIKRMFCCRQTINTTSRTASISKLTIILTRGLKET